MEIKELNMEAFNNALNKHCMNLHQDILEYIDLMQEYNTYSNECKVNIAVRNNCQAYGHKLQHR